MKQKSENKYLGRKYIMLFIVILWAMGLVTFAVLSGMNGVAITGFGVIGTLTGYYFKVNRDIKRSYYERDMYRDIE